MFSKKEKRLQEQFRSVAECYIKSQKGLDEDFQSSVEEYIDDADWFMYFHIGYRVSRFYVIDSVLNHLWKLSGIKY